MKKIKLFALAVMAMLGTNAMADEWANTTFTYEYASDADNALASIKGFIQDYPAGDMEEVTIPNTVKSKTGKTLKVDKILTKAFQNNKNIKKVTFSGANLSEIETLAFDGCTALAEVSFTAATGLTTIGADAFGKAPIVTLDLSTTKVAKVEKLFGTDFDNADKTKRVLNTTLTTVKLSNVWDEIKEKAFAGCTALATVNFGTVPTTGAPATQVFEAGKDNMFAGCPITSLDFSGTKVKTLPAGLLLDGTIYTQNESLTSVTLTKDFTALNAALSNCVNLATVTGYIKDPGKATAASSLTTLVNKEFQNDAKLTSFDFSLVTILGDYAFAGTGLTEVKFAKDKIANIPEGCFMDCASLATVTWDKADATLATIDEMAFAGTAIAAIDIPTTAPLGANADDIAEKAFAVCEKLVTFKWNPAANNAGAFNIDAFYLCNDYVTIYTDQATPLNYINHVQFKPYTAAPGTEFEKLTMTAYKNGIGKYYYKMNATADIAIAKGAAKVYDAWVDGADGSLNMQAYKANAGYYQIANGDVCLIVSETEEVEITDGDGFSTSISNVIGANALLMTAAATTRVALLLNAPDETYSLYGWVNSANGTGFQKITSGSSIAKDVLYTYAKEPAAGGRLIVKWYDEDGNLEGETTGIQSVEAQAAEAEGESFNLSGQKVAAGYKGIVIKNGKKMIVK